MFWNVKEIKKRHFIGEYRVATPRGSGINEGKEEEEEETRRRRWRQRWKIEFEEVRTHIFVPGKTSQKISKWQQVSRNGGGGGAIGFGRRHLSDGGRCEFTDRRTVFDDEKYVPANEYDARR